MGLKTLNAILTIRAGLKGKKKFVKILSSQQICSQKLEHWKHMLKLMTVALLIFSSKYS
jgi:hypothetical protein